MTDPAMSPAQKVLAAFKDRHELCFPFEDWVQLCLAAAIREAAYEVVPEPLISVQEAIRIRLLAIATELEAQP